MFKKRLIACLVVKGGIVVQSIGFKKYLPVGTPAIAVEFLNRWGIDEIALLDIDATAQKRPPDFDFINTIAKRNFTPLAVGGGIRNIDDMKKIIFSGAEKIIINKISLLNPKIIEEASKIFGSQSVTISIDVKINKNGDYEIFSDSGRIPTGINPVNWSKQVAELGAGEIFLNSIDRDGSKQGYDLKLIRIVSSSVPIPIIACGGVGHPRHFLEGINEGGASAVAAGNFFHFTEHSPVVAKSYLYSNKIGVRFGNAVNYQEFNFEESGRIAKMGAD